MSVHFSTLSDVPSQDYGANEQSEQRFNLDLIGASFH